MPHLPRVDGSMLSMYLIDDHCFFRSSLRKVLEGFPRFAVVGEAPTAESSFEDAALYQAHIVFVDRWVPDVDGIILCHSLIDSLDVKCVLLSSPHLSNADRAAAAEAGVSACVLKGAGVEALLMAIGDLP